MMFKIGKIEFKKISRVSPSQFYSMRNCAYKSLLAEAFDKKPLLPISPNAYFGTVLHKMLELITKGVVKNDEDFNTLFDDQLKMQEQYLQQHGFSFFIPLQKNVKDFGMKKVLLKRHLGNNAKKPSLGSNSKFYSEKWFESKDKLIAGKIDLVIERENEAEIIDFKTGRITQDLLDEAGEMFSEVKNEYKEQLKLYARLYFENTGVFPTQLSLVDLAKQKFDVGFTEVECDTLFQEAKLLLASTNESIEKSIFSANPSEVNCKYCLYRPACSFFLTHLETNYSFNDVSGLVNSIVKYQNGNISVFLENRQRKISITNFPSEKYDELNDSKNKQICVFNLRKDATDGVYSATKTTMIYEI